MMPICQICGRARTEEDIDYNPLQVILGGGLGWYSGDDGELCPECFKDFLDMANR